MPKKIADISQQAIYGIKKINKKMDKLSGLIFEDIKEGQKYKNYLLRVEK